MDCQISGTSSLPRIWAIETLACSNHVEISLLLDLLEKTPEICNDVGRNARELVALKILESFQSQGARANHALSLTIRLDPSDRCEDVLRRILNEISPTCLKSAGTEMSKWDLEPFIKHKRSNLHKSSLKQLKDAIHRGSRSIPASLKELSGLPVGNQSENEALVKDGNYHGIRPRVEGSNTRDFPAENLTQVNRKRRATSGSEAGNSCTTRINSVKKHKHDNISTEQYLGRKLMSSGADSKVADMSTTSEPQVDGESYVCEIKTHVGSMELKEPPKNDDNGCTSPKGLVGPDEVLPHGKQVSRCDTGINEKSKEQGQDQNIEVAKGVKSGFSDLKRTNEDEDISEHDIQNVGEVGELNSKSEEQGQDQNTEESKGDENGSSDLKRTNDGDNPEQNIQNDGEKEELNNKSEVQGQDQNIEEAQGGKDGFSDLKRTNGDVDNSEKNIQNVGEVDDHTHISNDNDENDDGRTHIAINENASFGPQCTNSQDPLTTTNCRDPNLLAGASEIYSGEERCSTVKVTCVEVMGRNGPSKEGNNQFTSPKGCVMNDEVEPHEKQAPHCGTEGLNETFDGAIHRGMGENAENGRKDFNGLISMNEDVDKFERNLQRSVPTFSEGEKDVDKFTDYDEYHDERTNIDTKKKLFLSSQCTYSQDSLATTGGRERQLCMKCNNIGNLLSCASNSCPLVIHESCLGSDADFDKSGKFYCPFCAYSRAISMYMDLKKKATSARKGLATFICLGPRQEPKKPSHRSFRIKGNHLQQGDGLSKSNELNQRDGVEKVSIHMRRRKLRFEKAGPSELLSGYSPPVGGKALDSTNRLAQSLTKDNRDGKSTRQVSQSLQAHGLKPIAAPENRNSQGESTSSQVSETSGSEKHADVISKKGVLHPPQTNLPCDRNEFSDAEELSEEDKENSGASKYFIRVRKQENQNFRTAVPQLRRKRLPWTSIEEDKLKEGIRLLCNPQDKTFPWRKILEHGAGVFQPSRSTTDLRDKWRNMCKGSPKSR